MQYGIMILEVVMSSSTEEWRSIKITDGAYEVSSCGRVRRGSKILKPSKTTGDYWFIVMCVNGKRIGRTIHRLVADAFLGEKPKTMQVNHKDGNKNNNSFENLEYLTPTEHYWHSYNTGLKIPVHGSSHWNSKLNEEIVRHMRSLRSSGMSVKDISKIVNVKIRQVYNILSGESWKKVD